MGLGLAACSGVVGGPRAGVLVYEVLPVRTPTIPPATHTNCYRFGRVVIDPASPYPDEQERTAEFAAGIDTILLTHHHADHIGGVADLRRRTGARVLAHADSRLPFPLDGTLVDGERIDTGDGVLIAMHTPGHADGHLAYVWEGTGIVVAGDLVAGEGTIVLVPPEGNLPVYLDSLRRVRTGATTLLPAHGNAVPAELADQYIAHRQLRTQQFLQALRGGAATAAAIAAVVYAGIPGVNLALAALQVETHLAWLVEQGAVASEGARNGAPSGPGGVAHYRVISPK